MINRIRFEWHYDKVDVIGLIYRITLVVITMWICWKY